MEHSILGLPGNREGLLGRPTHELTEDISAVFLLLSTVAHTGVNQDDIHNSEEDDDDNALMADVMSLSHDAYRVEKESLCLVGLAGEEAEELKEACK